MINNGLQAVRRWRVGHFYYNYQSGYKKGSGWLKWAEVGLYVVTDLVLIYLLNSQFSVLVMKAIGR